MRPGSRAKSRSEALIASGLRFSRPLVPYLRRAARWWPWLPLLFAAAYAVLFLANLRSLVEAVYWNADIVSAPYIGELYGHAPAGAQVVLGNISWFPALWFELATHGLPAHRQIWELAPYVASLIGVGLAAASAWLAAGRWAALTTAAVLAAAGPILLRFQFAWSVHALTYAEVALLGFFLVLCVSRGGLIARRPLHVCLVVLVGVLAALGLASDKLLIWSGLIPFVLATLAVMWISPRRGLRVAWSAGAVTALGILGAILLRSVVAAEHIATAQFRITFAPYDQIATHARLAVESMAYLFYGDFGGLSVSFISDLKLVCAGVVTIALLAGLSVLRGHARQLASRSEEQPSIVAETRTAYVAFWGWVLVLTIGTYALSSVATDPFTGRYLVSAAYALAALVTVGAGSGALPRAAVVCGVCVLVFAATLASGRRELQADLEHYPTEAVSGSVARFAQSEGLKYGYAGYWDAAPITWQAKAAIELFPISPCPSGLCPFSLHRISDWYVPRPGTRTFLVTDPSQPRNPVPVASLGRPDQTVNLAGLTVYVYPYDIASKFGAPY